jgi:quinol monooxygenase YgiN
MIHVIATIEVVAEKRADFLAEFQRIVEPTRAEAGCLEYGPTVDVASGLGVQGPVRDYVVTVVEKWENLQALHAHSSAPHMLDYRGRVKDLVVRVQLQVLQPAEFPTG